MVAIPLAAVPPTTATFDALYNWYLYIGVAATVVVIVLLVYFSLKYRASGPAQMASAHKPETWKIALVTAIISLSILTAVEYQTFASFSNIEIPHDPNAITVKVTGFQWGWNFTYPDGKYMIGNLTVPEGRTIILNITSRDVFHSFGIAFLAVKEDAIPGRINQAWFEMPNTGVYIYAIRCYELCGIGHATMIANLTVISQSAWNTWQTTGQGGA